MNTIIQTQNISNNRKQRKRGKQNNAKNTSTDRNKTMAFNDASNNRTSDHAGSNARPRAKRIQASLTNAEQKTKLKTKQRKKQ